MYATIKFLTWIVANAQDMRLSRAGTLAAIVSAALLMKGVGILPSCNFNDVRSRTHSPHYRRCLHETGEH